jgi:hypothetical protein
LSHWRTIAKNEIRLKTSRFRRKRKLFFIIIYGIFLFWAAFLGPVFLDSIIPEIFKNYTSNFEFLFVNLIESMLASLFLIYLVYPLYILFRREAINKKEIILSSPVKGGDIFLGEFLGQLPFYILFILGIGPFLTTLFLQINPNLTIFHHISIYLIFITLTIFSSLLGRFIAKWIEFNIINRGKLKKFKSCGLLLVSVSVLIIYFLLQFFLGQVKINQELRNLFLVYPSYWYSDLILYLINPSLLETKLIYIWLDLGLALILPALLLYLSYRFVKLPTNLDKIKYEDVNYSRGNTLFYKIIRKITPKKHENIVVIQFKNYIRKRENKIKLMYIFGLISSLGILIFIFLKDQTLVFEDIFLNIPLVIQITNRVEVIMLIISWMGGLIFGILVGTSTFFETKELLDVYKKTPRGIKGFVSPLLFVMFYHLVLLSIFFSILFTIIFQLGLLITLIFSLVFILNSLIILLQTIGIQFIRPLFLERRKNLVVNNYLVLFMQVVSLLLTMYIIIPVMSELISPSTAFVSILLVNIAISSGLGALIISFGIWKIKRMD